MYKQVKRKGDVVAVRYFNCCSHAMSIVMNQRR